MSIAIDHRGNAIPHSKATLPFEVHAKVGPTADCRVALNVERSTTSLEDSVDDLRAALAGLAERLEPLLSPSRPMDSGDTRGQGESELAERILRSSDIVQAVSLLLRDLTARL